MTFAVRVIGPADWRRYRDLRLRALRDAPEAFTSSYEAERSAPANAWQRRLESAASGGSAYFVALQDDEWIGLAGCRIEDGVPWLVSMWVTPGARRRGAGKALVEAVSGWARNRGFESCGCAFTPAMNRPAACKRRLGSGPSS